MLVDGTVQSFYFPDGHERAGVSKGWLLFLKNAASKIQVSCELNAKASKCAPPAIDCCCRWVLFNQPDFAHVDTILEILLAMRADFKSCSCQSFIASSTSSSSVGDMLNGFIALNPELSREDHLEKNALTALDAIPIVSMRRYVTPNYDQLCIDNKNIEALQIVHADLLTHMTKG